MNNIKEKSDFVYDPSTIENVDIAFYNWLDKKMNLSVETNRGFKKVPIIWSSGERSWQVKNKKDKRDSNNNFIFPVMSIERVGIEKSINNKGKYWGDVHPINDEKGGSIAVHTIINQDKTSNFANADSKRLTGQPNFRRKNNKIVYQTKFIQMPVYVTMTYVIDIKTEYQQQMNDILQAFTVFGGALNYFLIEDDGHRYEAFIDGDYKQENNISKLEENERLFNTKITIRVLSHIVTKSSNNEQPIIPTRENIVEIKLPKEYTFFEEPEKKIIKSLKPKDKPLVHSTIENVDTAIYNWLYEKMNLFADTNTGWKKVPIIWSTGERSWLSKNYKGTKDKNNNFILPVITLERTNISKEKNKKGKFWGDVHPIKDIMGGSIAVHTILNQEKTSNFANADSKKLTGQPNFKRENKKIVYQTKFLPMPVYTTVTYVIDIKTEYQQQMNEILQAFLTFTGGINYFIAENEGHRYEVFIDKNYEQNNNVSDLKETERLFNTKITINTLSHLVGQINNSDKPKIPTRENIVEIKLPKEYTFFEEPENKLSSNNRKEEIFKLSTIEDVDTAMYEWLEKRVNLFADTNTSWKKVPVIWSQGERSWQVKRDLTLRDKNNNFILPVISVERIGINKEKDKRGKYWNDVHPVGDEKGGSIPLYKKINQEKTSNFANADSKRLTGQPNFKRENKKIVYDIFYSPMIVYTTISYVLDIKTEYQQQMNEIMQYFLTTTGGLNYFILSNEQNRYEAFIDESFEHKNNSNNLETNERLFNTQIKINVLANIVGASKNAEQPKIISRQNIVEIKFPKEYAILGEDYKPTRYLLDNALVDENVDYILTSEGDFILIPK